MAEITTLNSLKNKIKPYTATLVGGAFDLFHIGHLRYLRQASKFSKPLIVIVQTDKMVSVRKGLTRPIIKQKYRAEIIAALDFVDFVLILDKPSHYDGYLTTLKPKHLVLYKENLTYRKRRAGDIQKQHPRIRVEFVAGRKVMSTSRIVKKIIEKPNTSRIKDPIKRELHILAEESKAKVGKISALIIKNKKIILKAGNTKTESHAEAVVLKLAKKTKIDLEGCELYILIPPCISCAENIMKSKIKNVYYLYPYGNDDGVTLLRKNGIKVRRYK